MKTYTEDDAAAWLAAAGLWLAPALAQEGVTRAFAAGRLKAGSTPARQLAERVVLAGRLALARLTEPVKPTAVGPWFAKALGLVQSLSAAATAALFGQPDLGPTILDGLAGLVTRQARYLARFRDQLRNGGQDPGEAAANRAAMYADATWSTGWTVLLQDMAAIGMKFGRRVLGVADHCEECVDLAGLGWTPIQEVVPIGNASCHVRCHCHLEFR